MFRWRNGQDPENQGMTAWAIFARDSQYFDPGRSQTMINYPWTSWMRYWRLCVPKVSRLFPTVRNTIMDASRGLSTRRVTKSSFGNRRG